MVKPKIGDKISVPWRPGVRHFLVYTGPRGPNGEDVIHNAKKGGVKWGYLWKVVDGRPAKIEQRAEPGSEEEVVCRAIAFLGTPYSLLNFNCEHLASVAQDGVKRSYQLRRSIGIAVGLGLIVTQLEGGDYDRKVGRYRDERGRFVAG